MEQVQVATIVVLKSQGELTEQNRIDLLIGHRHDECFHNAIEPHQSFRCNNHTHEWCINNVIQTAKLQVETDNVARCTKKHGNITHDANNDTI